MARRRAWIAAVLLVSVCVTAQDENGIYRICVTERQATSDDCNILKQFKSKFACVRVIDNTDCALKLESGEADFGIFTAEEAILTTKFDRQQQRTVIGEIREKDRDTEQFQFETVAIVKDGFTGPLSAVQGKNFCHPGFRNSQIWTDRVLKHFERVILNRTVVCDKSLRTSIEDELSALSSFFTKSCRPGPWVSNEYIDKKLKSQYPSLCQLCDSPVGCSQNPQTDGNQFSTLDCLTKKGGDVAYVAYYYAQLYFGLVATASRRVDPAPYRYLCPNGTIQNIASNPNPCKWISQPWPSIIAKDTSTAEKLRTELQSLLPTNVGSRRINEWIDTLSNIIIGSNKLVLIPTILLRQFIEKGREIPEPGTTLPCQNPMKWCTISDAENNKCEWLRQAGITQGIVPEIACVQASNQMNCFRMIKNGEADVMGTDANMGVIAGHFFNLTTTLYQDTESRGHFKIVAIVKSDASFTNIMEMENKEVCFPEFGALAWISFVEAIRGSSLSGPNVCAYDDSLGEFFSSVCAPGAKNRLLNVRGNDTRSDLCALCSDAFRNSDTENFAPFSSESTIENSCDATTKNKFYGDVGALRCLGTGVADVAFINAYNLSTILQDDTLPHDFAQNYKIWCRDGRKLSLDADVDNNCALAVVTGGEVIARGTRSNIENRELYLTLLELDEWFGYTNSHHESIFHLYEPFNNKLDLLFRNEALGFITQKDKDEEESTKTYALLKKNAEICVQKSGTQGIRIGLITPLLMMTVTVIHRLF